MEKPNLFWAANLKYLRNRKKLSQDELATELGITRVKLNSHEQGTSRNPPLEDLIKFSEFFKMSIDSLLKIDLSRISELKIRELEAGNDVYVSGSNIRVLAITVDKKSNENVEYVPVKSQAGYLNGYNDPEFIGQLSRYSIPGLPKSGTFRIFSLTGDSMLPLEENAEVIGQYVQDWTALKPGTPCHIIIKGESRPVFKLLTMQGNGKALLKSLNSLFTPYEVDASNILEVWRFHSYISKKFPQPESDMNQLTNVIMDLKHEIKNLKQR